MEKIKQSLKGMEKETVENQCPKENDKILKKKNHWLTLKKSFALGAKLSTGRKLSTRVICQAKVYKEG